jgi:predicted dehydrogenase
MKDNNLKPGVISRHDFLKLTGMAGAATLLTSLETWADTTADKKIRIAVIGCGSVSNAYLPQLLSSKMIEVVSLCDIKYERAVAQNEKYRVNAKTYRNIDEMLAGVQFDMMVTLTDMQVHEGLNRKALIAGKHVWSEKPLANSFKAGKELLDLSKSKNLRLWGAPAVVNSPQFAYMSKAIQDGKLGLISSAHAQYGHTGPGWSAFFYEKGGGSMPDLGVYNMTTLTGLLGPARSVTAMLSTVKKERTVDDKGTIKVETEDNAHVLLEHDNNVISHIMSGFNFFDPHGHEAGDTMLHSIQIYGDQGNMRLLGYDWETNGVVIDNSWTEPAKIECTEKGGYQWQEGARVVAESMLAGIEPKINVEHALHVLEIIEAAQKSQETGQRIQLVSKFPFPVVK